MPLVVRISIDQHRHRLAWPHRSSAFLWLGLHLPWSVATAEERGHRSRQGGYLPGSVEGTLGEHVSAMRLHHGVVELHAELHRPVTLACLYSG